MVLVMVLVMVVVIDTEFKPPVAVHIRYRAHNCVMGPVSYMDGDSFKIFILFGNVKKQFENTHSSPRKESFSYLLISIWCTLVV